MTTKHMLIKSFMIFLCLGMIILSGIFLQNSPKFLMYISVSYFSFMAVIYAALEQKFLHFSRIIIFLIVSGVIVILAYIILSQTGWLQTLEDMNTIKQFILDMKQWGVIGFVLLTIFQVVILPIPSAITILIGVAIYGPTWSFILSTIGTVIGSLICFILGKIFGKKLVIWMIGEEKTEKYAELINNKGKFIFIIMMLFPFFPDDMLCICAGITAMTYKFFTIVILITRPIMIVITSYLGSGDLIPFSGWGIPVWIAVFCLMFVLFILLNRFKKIFIRKANKEDFK